MISATVQEPGEKLLSFIEKLDSLALEFTNVYVRKYPAANVAQIQQDLDNLLLRTFVENIKPSLRTVSKNKDFISYEAAKTYMREKAFEDSKKNVDNVGKLTNNFARFGMQKDAGESNSQYYRPNFNANSPPQEYFRRNAQPYFNQRNGYVNRNFDNRQNRAFSEPIHNRVRQLQDSVNNNAPRNGEYYRNFNDYRNANFDRNANFSGNTNFQDNRNVSYGGRSNAGYFQNNVVSDAARASRPSSSQQFSQQQRYDRPQFEQRERDNSSNKQ